MADGDEKIEKLQAQIIDILKDQEKLEKKNAEGNYLITKNYKKELSELKVRSAAHTEDIDGIRRHTTKNEEEINNNTELTREFNRKRVREIGELKEQLNKLDGDKSSHSGMGIQKLKAPLSPESQPSEQDVASSASHTEQEPVNKICTFYLYGDSEGECMMYGSNDITKSLFCKDIKCEYKEKEPPEDNVFPDENYEEWLRLVKITLDKRGLKVVLKSDLERWKKLIRGYMRENNVWTVGLEETVENIEKYLPGEDK